MTPYFNGLFLDSSPLDLGSVKTVSAVHTVAPSAENRAHRKHTVNVKAQTDKKYKGKIVYTIIANQKKT